MKLNGLNLRNFKGIENLSIVPNGQDLDIYGENGAGKTTIMDGFMWLLFDKDSNNSSNFNIKTLDENGQAINGLEHEVKGTLVIEDRVVELQKIYKEKWTKKRGEADQTLTGHSTDYYIDGVPKRKKDYTEFLEKIIDEDTFRILTNPLYFNTKLDWKKRREIALSLVDEVDIEDVLKKDKKLTELKELLVGDLSIEDLKAKTQATKRKLNKELEQIPVRIDELSRQDLDENIDCEVLESEKHQIEKQIEGLRNNVIYTEKLEELKQEVAYLESWKLTFERDKTVALNQQYKDVNIQLQGIQKEFNSLNSSKQKVENEISLLENRISFKEQELDSLRSEWDEIIKDEFDTSENICRTCGQELQIEKQQENIERFNHNKQERKNKNSETGKKFVAEVTELKEQLKVKKEELSNLEIQISDKEKDINIVTSTLDTISKQLEAIDFNSFEEYKETSLKIIRLNREIENILADNKEKSQEQQNIAIELQSNLNNINALLAKKELIETNLKRVEELKEEERELALKIADLEKIEMQCESFIVTKAELLEDKLNSKFKLVKFKLFNKLVNGAIDETFVTTVNGVPYEDLNNAMKINAGLDIINTLTKHYNFNAPIFIDNRESVNEIIDIDSQIINLIVSKDKELRIESKNVKGVA